MSQLTELLESVREKNLTKTQLEDYRDEMTALFAQMQLQLADLEKEEAKYLASHGEKTDVNAKRKWGGTESGQRLIELKRFSKATEKMLSSLKSRIYAQY